MDTLPAEIVALILGHLKDLPDETARSWADRNTDLARLTRMRITEVSSS